MDLRMAERQMEPGVVSLHGFLGQDQRSLEEILKEDDELVRTLGSSHKALAEFMRRWTDVALTGFGSPVRRGSIEAVIREVRGTMACPFGDRSDFRKGEICLTDLESGERIVWTPLQIHMVGEHGFYEGKGSPYRLEPEELLRFRGRVAEDRP